MVIKSLVDRFLNCVHEKNYTNIIRVLRNLLNEIKASHRLKYEEFKRKK